jgi:hypothetical protein
MFADKHDHWFLDPGPLLPWIDEFAADLAAQRYGGTGSDHCSQPTSGGSG